MVLIMVDYGNKTTFSLSSMFYVQCFISINNKFDFKFLFEFRFDNVRIPRENLLNSVADVSTDGQYLSAIKDPDQVFINDHMNFVR